MAGAAVFMRTVGLGRLFNALSTLIEAAQEEDDWWVGTVVEYSAFPEFGTSKMRARPYFQPAILRTGREMQGAFPRSVGRDRANGRTLWALMVGSEEGLAKKIALRLERNVKQEIKRKGLIDTGNLRASITAAPTLPKMERESASQVPAEIVSRSGRSRIVNR